MSNQKTETTDLGRVAYEKHIEFYSFSVPRWGQRTALWGELTDKMRQEWNEVAQAVLTSLAQAITKGTFKNV